MYDSLVYAPSSNPARLASPPPRFLFECCVGALEKSVSGGQFDFVRLLARVEGPHGAHVWRS